MATCNSSVRFRTVAVFMYYHIDNTLVDLQFNLSVTSDNFELCPNSCSGNGNCDPTTGQCSCNTAYSGYDCSVTQQILNAKNNTNMLLQAGQLGYALIPASLTNQTLILTVAKPTDKSCTVVFRMD